MKAVLSTAQHLKRKFPSEKEEILILRSICDVNLPKFLTEDIQLFMGIVADLFPGIKVPSPEYQTMNNSISHVLVEMNLQNVINFRKKVL